MGATPGSSRLDSVKADEDWEIRPKTKGRSEWLRAKRIGALLVFQSVSAQNGAPSADTAVKLNAKVYASPAQATKELDKLLAKHERSSKGKRTAYAISASPGWLRFAVSSADRHLLRGLLADHAAIEDEAGDEAPLLVTAITDGVDPVTVSALLAAGADPNVTDTDGDPAIVRLLYNAPSSRSEEPIRALTALLKAGARATAPGSDEGKTALHVAASYGLADAVQALLDHGADADAKTTGASPQKPIDLARAENALHVVALLAKRPASS